MRTGTEQEKLKSIAVHTVNEQPVGPDVALPEADIISGESVVTVPVRQSLPAASQSTTVFSSSSGRPRLAASLRSFLNRLERTTSSIRQHLIHGVLEGSIALILFR